MRKGQQKGNARESRKSSQCKVASAKAIRLYKAIQTRRERQSEERAEDEELRVLQLLGDARECNSRTLLTVALALSTCSYPAWHKSHSKSLSCVSAIEESTDSCLHFVRPLSHVFFLIWILPFFAPQVSRKKLLALCSLLLYCTCPIRIHIKKHFASI